MEELSIVVFLTVFPILGVLLVIWFRQLSKFLDYLRTRHPDEYEAMGRPTVFRNSRPGNNLSFLRFIMGDRSHELGDKRLIQWCRFLRRFMIVYLTLFFGLILVLVAGVIFSP